MKLKISPRPVTRIIKNHPLPGGFLVEKKHGTERTDRQDAGAVQCHGSGAAEFRDALLPELMSGKIKIE